MRVAGGGGYRSSSELARLQRAIDEFEEGDLFDADAPGGVNDDPMAAWFFRIKPADGVSLDGFMDEAAYNELIG